MNRSEIHEKLENLNFIEIGEWRLKNDKLAIEAKNQNSLLVQNSLYIFIVSSNNDYDIKYIGKTTKTLKHRFYQYSLGNGKSTNSKIHKNIKLSLEKKQNVMIWAYLDNTPLLWGSYNINIAAGLEDSMISEEEPDWNGGKTETYEIEKNDSDIPDIENNSFPIKIAKTYYNYGLINPGVEASKILGEHDEKIAVKIGSNQSSIKVNRKIDRNANSNGSIRISAIPELAEYYQKNYNLGEIARLEIISENELQII